MNHQTVPADLLPAAFESASLIQCTDAGRPPARRRPMSGVVHAPRPFAEFDHEDAAGRLAGLLDELGLDATHEARIGGGRRRYTVQRVLVPPRRREDADRLLAAAWHQGRRMLLSTDPLGASSPRNAQRVTLARAAWRAALLAGGRRLRPDFLGVRLGGQEMAAILVRAARVLGATATVMSRPGCILVTVADPTDRTRVLTTLTPRLPQAA
ncbi:hypothetical protein [Phytohabitans rumicis]|uniref:Uncharacterized protein n=1 Tax=Phytohabitans rumicis TaxID=1076125 RepID=A0A6V8LHI7_9ACTN|nr:hypothetical protein [Phytohabitans rumicis]GFJ94388.1 hypothetical protein Prum_080300 [Phytohabitans rumicis]